MLGLASANGTSASSPRIERAVPIVMTYPGSGVALEHPAKPLSPLGGVSRHAADGGGRGRARSATCTAIVGQADLPSLDALARELLGEVGAIAAEHLHGRLPLEGVVRNEGVVLVRRRNRRTGAVR